MRDPDLFLPGLVAVWYGMCVLHRVNHTIMEREVYLPPDLEVLEVPVELGFAASAVDGGVEGFDREDWNG